MADINIVFNGDFSDGIEPWYPNGCAAFVVSSDPFSSEAMFESSTGGYVVVTNRNETWQGLEQDITTQISSGITYTVSASVGVSGPFHESAEVLSTVRLEYEDSPTEYLFIGKTYASRDKWVDLKGTFLISNMPERVILYLEGPAPGKDLLIRSVTVKDSTSSSSEFQETGQDTSASRISPPALCIIKNHDFSDGLYSWTSNRCDSFVVSNDECKSDSYAVVNNRNETWQGLEQDITDRVFPSYSYKVSATVSVSGPVQRSAQVLATLKLEHQNSAPEFQLIGKTYASKDIWKTLGGTFVFSGKPDRVVFFLEGPPPGVDLLIKSVTIHCESDNQLERSREFFSAPEADTHIFLNSSFSDGLNHWSGRGCNLMLHDSLANGKILPHSGTSFASATGRTHKWSGIEQDITKRVQRKLIYEASSVVRLSHSHHTVQATLYVQYLNQREEYIGISSVQAQHDNWVQLKGKFLLNGSPARAVVYIEGPPPGIDVFVDHFIVKPAEKTTPSRRPYIDSHAFGMNIVSNSHLRDGTVEGWFPLGSCHLKVGEGSPRILPPLARDSLRTTHGYLSGRYVLATLFLNEYHIEDGFDSRSSPEKYIKLVHKLQKKGAPVGGIGIQGHITSPVGHIVRSALDKLSKLGLPIWFTELDVSSTNEHIRGDDLEVMLWEAFAHPAVEGVLLWGFWELFMSREHSHLVNADGEINEAGKRFLEIKREWLTFVDRVIGDEGELEFRGYHGSYTVEVVTSESKYVKSFVVDKGNSPVDIIIDL